MSTEQPNHAAYETALPDDPRIARKKMFGSPCAFINRRMFFGTFEDKVVARVGPKRVAALVDQPGMDFFSPSEGKVWDDYICLDGTVDAGVLSELAVAALAYAEGLPARVKRPKTRQERRARKRQRNRQDVLD